MCGKQHTDDVIVYICGGTNEEKTREFLCESSGLVVGSSLFDDAVSSRNGDSIYGSISRDCPSKFFTTNDLTVHHLKQEACAPWFIIAVWVMSTMEDALSRKS